MTISTESTEMLPTAYAELLRELRETALFASATGVLSWDQETMMPAGGAKLRAEQIALLSGLVHERRTTERVGDLIEACEADPELRHDSVTAANLREIRRDYDRATRLPTPLVRELAQTTSTALQAWRDARERSDFPAFAPLLEEVFRLSRSVAECHGAERESELYDALLQEYEPGMDAAQLESSFAALRERLVPLIREVSTAPRPEARAQSAPIPVGMQAAFNERVATRMGFRFDEGRFDTSTHPFCTGIGPGDTRLTSRFREDYFPDALSSTMHEVGHGLYEQGLPKEKHFGQPLAEAASLGIHESQSRLWENQVGRSRAFWRWAFPEAQQAFGDALAGVTEADLYRVVNLVEPNLIRVDSDEVTYNLHVMLRFDLERALLSGDLPVADLPGAWNERIRADLGLRVPDDRRGCLQDIHWSMGAIGYFPTYTLGNLYATQIWEAARRALPDMDEHLARGDFGELLGWLRTHVHAAGRRYPAPELCERVTGSPLSAEPLLSYLDTKIESVYG